MSPLGYLTGIGAGFFSSLEGLVGKTVMNDRGHPVLLGLGWHGVGALVLLLFAGSTGRLQSVSAYTAMLKSPSMLGWIGLNAGAFLCYLIGLNILNLSCVIPLLATVPLVAGLAEVSLFGRTVGLLGFVALGLICTGAYLVSCYDEGIISYTKPFKLFRDNPGSLVIAAAVLLWSLSINLSGTALDQLPFLSSIVLMEVGLAVFFAISAVVWGTFSDAVWRVNRSVLYGIVAIGVLNGVTIMLHYATVDYLVASYASGLKRVNIVFSYLFGLYFLNEPTSRGHAVSVGVILVGALFLMVA